MVVCGKARGPHCTHSSQLIADMAPCLTNIMSSLQILSGTAVYLPLYSNKYLVSGSKSLTRGVDIRTRQSVLRPKNKEIINYSDISRVFNQLNGRKQEVGVYDLKEDFPRAMTFSSAIDDIHHMSSYTVLYSKIWRPSFSIFIRCIYAASMALSDLLSEIGRDKW